MKVPVNKLVTGHEKLLFVCRVYVQDINSKITTNKTSGNETEWIGFEVKPARITLFRVNTLILFKQVGHLIIRRRTTSQTSTEKANEHFTFMSMCYQFSLL